MAISLHTPETIYSARHTPSWFALACAAGSVNGFAFLTAEQFVSHVTGTATRIGLEWHHLTLAAKYASIMLSFISGATASVVWIQARHYRGKQPRWATPLFFVAIILLGTAFFGHLGSLGPFGAQIASDPPPFLLLSLLAFAMGLQNAAVASTTGLAVRTTHLTGPATDLGIHLGTTCFAAGAARKAELRGAALRAGKMIAFILGALLSVPLARNFGYLVLIAPAALVTCAAILSFLPAWSPSDLPLLARIPLPKNFVNQSKKSS